MVRTSGIAWNRLALLINFYSDTALLIPIHGLCVAGKNTFLPVFASGFSAKIEVRPALQIICKFLSEFDILCKLTRSTLIKMQMVFIFKIYLLLNLSDPQVILGLLRKKRSSIVCPKLKIFGFDMSKECWWIFPLETLMVFKVMTVKI